MKKLKLPNRSFHYWIPFTIACKRIAAVLASLVLLAHGEIGFAADAGTANGAAGIPEDITKAMSMPKGAERNAALVPAIKAWVDKSPADAVTWATNINTSSDRETCLFASDTASAAWVAKDDLGAAEWALKNPSGLIRHYIFRNFGEKDPARAIPWIMAKPEEQHKQAIGALIEGWCKIDVKAASEWALSAPPADAMEGVYSFAIGLAGKNPQPGMDWVPKIKDDEFRAAAVSCVGFVWARRYPNQADQVKDWIKQQSIPEDKKTAAVARVEETVQKLKK